MACVDLQEKANFTRLSRLLVDKGTEALRTTFDAIHPPASLPAVLNANRKSLLRLKFKVINNAQWDLLFPPSGNPPDSKTFDVTLLTVLFRNICGLPSTGWGVMPPDTDRSLQANVARIKLFRNEVYAHVSSTLVDNATFESLWQKISQALVELKIPQNDVDDLKTCPLGPEENIYVKILENWKLQEDACMKVLEGLDNDVKSMKIILEENQDGIKQLCQSTLEQDSNIEALLSITRMSQVEENCNKGSDEDLLRELAKHNFKSKIGRKVESFQPGTRKWLLNQVDMWFVENERESRMLLLTAGPGFGKSVFAAKVCEDFEKKGKLAACHFCDFSNSNLRDPMMMLQSLASQMCENVVGFKEKLLDQLKRPHQVRSLKDAFGIYLQNPLDELELHEPSLVVIDGLDESAADLKNEIMNMIADCFPDLPKCIKVLVTSRPEISVAKLSGVQKINIANDDARNEFDLEFYFKACLPSLAGRIVQMPARTRLQSLVATYGVFKVLASKCQGSFLYAFHVQSELRKRDDLDKMTSDEIIEFLPEDLDSIYQGYFKRFEDELKAIKHENFDVLRILEMLAASEGPLPLTFITRALGLAPDCRETKDIINKVNETVSCLLYVSDELVTVFHKSVIDWLLAEGYKDHEYTVNVSDGDRSLWLICEPILEEIKKTVRSGHDLNLTNEVKYALCHGLEHLVACEVKESIFWLVDVVIIHTLLIVHLKSSENDLISIFNLWVRILQSAVVISDELRARISWHVVEIKFMNTFYVRSNSKSSPFYYLQSVLTHSPKGYFSDNEKKIAKSLLSTTKISRFVESVNFDEVEVMPRAVWGLPSTSKIIVLGLSHDKTMAAVARGNGTINMISVPSLVERWQCSTEYERISCCTFSPDDSFVLFGELGTVVNIAEREEVPFFHGNKETFLTCAFSPNGKRLVTSNGSSTVKVWNVVNQSLLSLLCADVCINWCSFCSTGLFITGGFEFDPEDYCDSDPEYYPSPGAFCVWNAITWQRSDERKLPDVKREEGKVIHSKLCRRCFRSGFIELSTSNTYTPLQYWQKPWIAGIYNGVECIFALEGQFLSVKEKTHFTTLAAWNFFVNSPNDYTWFRKIRAIEDDLWLYADEEKLIVFRTLAPTQEQSSCLPRPTQVFSSSFSPDGSRLATCTSDGYINIWNVYTSQVEQSFKSNQGESSFSCWWSEKFLFVCDLFDRVPSLSKYPVDVNLKIQFYQSQQVSLCHLVDEFVPLLAIVDFAEGLLSFECGETKRLIVLDGVGEPRMVTLPGIKHMKRFTASTGASFVYGCDEDTYYIWKRNAEEPTVYEVFFTESFILREDYFNFFYSKSNSEHVCCFSNDSKVAVVQSGCVSFKIFDLDTGDHKSVCFEPSTNNKLFCLSKDRIVIAATRHYFSIFDMDSGALLDSSFQRYLTRDSSKRTQLSQKDTMLAFPKLNGDMKFLRLCIPPNPLLASIKHEAAINWHNKLEEKKKEYKALR